MAWLGESFANIKGQISSFTKEVLAPEEQDDAGDTEQSKPAQKAVSDLEMLCSEQKFEIEQLRTNGSELHEKLEVLDRQNKTVVESYQRVIQTKDLELLKLREQIDELQKEKEELESSRRQDESVRDISGATQSTQVQEQQEYKSLTPTPLPSAQTSDATTVTEDLVEFDETISRELQERCDSYQNDLFVMRDELLSFQSEVDQSTITGVKLNEQILQILHSEFVIDGHPALGKQKHSNFNTPNEGIQFILSLLAQLASVWKGLLEKKGTLERTVSKLTVHQSKPTILENSIDLDLSERSLTGVPLDYFQPKVDSFCLETIIEDETGEDEGRADYEHPLEAKTASGRSPVLHRSKTSPSPPTFVPTVCISTQTEFEQVDPEVLKTQVMKSLESTWLDKEHGWVSKVEEREGRIQKLQSDLERLQTHLVDLEDQYTNEALVAEEKEKQLRLQVAQLQREANHSLLNSDKNSEMKEEISRLIAERDQSRNLTASVENQLEKVTVQLQNLHFVLEQFQKEKDNEVASMKRNLISEMDELHTRNDELSKELEAEKALLERAKLGLAAAQELNVQIEEKGRIVSQLKLQVQEKEAEVSKLKSQMEEVATNLDGKIDKYLVKNLVVGYFSTPVDKRKEVLRIIANALDFNREDRQKTGLEATSLWPFRPGGETSSAGDKQSLSEAFIRFLESESQPKVELRIPVEEMTRRHSRTASTSSSSSAAGDASASPGARVGTSGSPAPVSEISMALPILNQPDRSHTILKDVLHPKS